MKKLTLLFTGMMTFAASAEISPRLDHVALRVTDMDRSIQFYDDAFGLKLSYRWDEMTIGGNTIKNPGALLSDGQGGSVEIFGDGDASQRRAVQQPINHFGFAVEDIEAAYIRAVNAGAQGDVPPIAVSADGANLKIAFVIGLDGERIELTQHEQPGQ